VESVAEVEVVPSVRGGDGLVHFDVKATEFLNFRNNFLQVVQPVVNLSQSLGFPYQNPFTCKVIVLTRYRAGISNARIDEGFETACRSVSKPCLKTRSVLNSP
jgi:hypothetical protein